MYIQSDNRLLEMPLAVLVMAVFTVAMPSLTALRGRAGSRR